VTSDHVVLRSRRVVLPGVVEPADVTIEGERIAGVEPPSARRSPDLDLGDLVLMAGLVDAHVHVNEPGRTEWEGFRHATRAAAAGGVTMIADMPLNSDPVTTTTAALEAKRAAAAAQCWVDVGFHAGVVPDNAHRPDVLRALALDGVLAFKAFLCDSGIPEFPAVGRAELESAMPVLAAAGARLLAHAEIAGAAMPPATRIESYRDWEASRPQEWEHRAIELLIELCRSTGCPVHIVHLAAGDALPAIRAARAEGLPLTVETCPHYLRFAMEDLPDRDPRFKCAPPIRGRENRGALWSALADGTLDLIASDHSPCPPDWKRRGDGDLAQAWGGISSLQLLLPVVWTLASLRGHGVERIAEWLARAPAALLGLDHDRGSIAPGRLASLVAWDPDRSFVVRSADLHHRHPLLAPYAGEILHGVVERTWVRGREVACAGEIAPEPRGTLVTRGPSLRDRLARCCAARAWIDAMLAAIRAGERALSPTELAELSDRCFDRLERADWLEAFAGHPRIGDLESLRHRFASTADLAASEQAGARGASDKVLRALAQGNDDYERRFGHLFVVCATGKSAAEMLDLLLERMANDPATELRIAAGEQRKITRLRLQAL
jgi:allantoinase